MQILVINCGSSSIKYQMFNMIHSRVMTTGVLESIGETNSCLTHQWIDSNGDSQQQVYQQNINNHKQAFKLIQQAIQESGEDLQVVNAVGHRVVHGGEHFQQPVIINDEVIKSIHDVSKLAPLHNPANLIGIEITRRSIPDVPHIAVFDTAFHHTIPSHAFRYAIPENLYRDYGIRRYGFHGTSHCYVAKQAANYLERPLNSLKLISLHLGNGASVAAINKGNCIDTSMGMTPLEGLIMGTRSGDIDPAIPLYLANQANFTLQQVDTLLNKKSGLKGICNINDMREIQLKAKQNDGAANLAIKMYCYRIKKYIGSYYAILGGLDVLIFTAGIGENSALIREQVCAEMEHLGIYCEQSKNQNQSAGIVEINIDSAPVKILIISTNEELEIAQQTLALLQ